MTFDPFTLAAVILATVLILWRLKTMSETLATAEANVTAAVAALKAEVAAGVAAVAANVSALSTEIVALKAQIAANTPPDLTALDQAVTDINASTTALTAALNPPPPAPAA